MEWMMERVTDKWCDAVPAGWAGQEDRSSGLKVAGEWGSEWQQTKNEWGGGM